VILASSLVTTYGYFQMWGIEFFPGVTHNEFPSSSFGFQNMAAEFIAISLVIQFSLFLQLPNKSSFKSLKWIILVLHLSYLYLLSSRASILGIAVVVCLLIYFALSRKNTIIFFCKCLSLSAVLILFCINFAPHLRVVNLIARNVASEKDLNNKMRILRWKNTSYMATKNFEGIGPGRYEFGYMEFDNIYGQDPESNETWLLKSPHNVFLQVAVEYGITMLVILLFFLTWIFKNLHKNLITKHRENSILVFSFFVFVCIDGFFSFPMENAMPFYFSSIFFGKFFLPFENIKITNHFFKPLYFFAFGFCLFLTISFSFSKFYDFNYPFSYKKISIACSIWPQNWRACVKKGEFEIMFNQPRLAIQTYQEMLIINPKNFIALRHLGHLHLDSQEKSKGCYYLKEHLKLLHYPSLTNSYFENFCN
jgi:O-antigen ligase